MGNGGTADWRTSICDPRVACVASPWSRGDRLGLQSWAAVRRAVLLPGVQYRMAAVSGVLSMQWACVSSWLGGHGSLWRERSLGLAKLSRRPDEGSPCQFLGAEERQQGSGLSSIGAS